MYQSPEGVVLFYNVRAFYITPSGFIAHRIIFYNNIGPSDLSFALKP